MTGTKLEQVRDHLSSRNLQFGETELSTNQTQIMVEGFDAVINIWHSTGTCQVQGRDGLELQTELGDLVGRGGRRGRTFTAPVPSAVPAAPASSGPKKVFVVYGHDPVRAEVDAMLRRWGLDPLFLDQLPSGGNTIIEKLEYYQDGVEWAVVLLTPDDLGHPALDPTRSAPRPRQNVVLEMGMLIGKLGRGRVAILYKESDPPMELPSDIHGYIYISFRTAVDEAGPQLAKEMAAADFHEVPVRDI